jgi:hypothetical protein
MIDFDRIKESKPGSQAVSGATPETTRGTRVPPTVSVRTVANNTILN